MPAEPTVVAGPVTPVAVRVEAGDPLPPPAAGAPEVPGPHGPGRLARWWAASPLRWYLAAIGLTAVAVTVMMRLWRADLRSPFFYDSDALGHAAHFKTTLETGWYETQPRLGAPFGQHYHDFPFSDDLHPAMAKLLGLFTSDWVVAFNTYYLLTFLLCAGTAVWFFRQCRLTPWMAVALSVLYAVAPYHFIRNEGHLFLSAYYLIAPAMVIVLRVSRGERVWGLRPGVGRIRGVLTGRGAGTVVILALLVWDGVYYAVFVGLLLIAAALLAFARTRDRWRLGGAVMGGAVLAGWYLVALVPDMAYGLAHGFNGASFVREPNDAQFYGLRFAQLVLPPLGHPFPPFAELRVWFDDRYPPTAEFPALGLLAAVGFVLLLFAGLGAIAGARRRRRAVAALRSGPQTFAQLSALTWVAFLLATTGGLGLFLSMAITGIRDWNRMSIVIGLLGLAGLGLVVEAGMARLLRRWPTRPRLRRWLRSPLIAAVVLVVGLADQSLDSAVPPYAESAALFHSDQAFFGALQDRLPADSMVFQLPFRRFPESPKIGDTTESDQLRPFLNTTTLRWSAAGIKGRPETDWPEEVVDGSTEDMVRDLAVIGFVGIVIDRAASPGDGSYLEQRLEPYVGPVQAVSQDGRWSYVSLDRVRNELRLSMSPAQIAAQASAITHVPG